jgi:hypothetical protein
MTSHLETAVAFFIFNRPDTTHRVFDEIRRARPSKLLVVADGPRADRLGEAEKCRATRSVVERVDWPCEVLTNFSEVNLGCKRRISSGLDWVFENVEQAIILEDDCLPHPTFFRYCEELLKRYADNPRIMVINGTNYHDGKAATADSYSFYRYPHVWGWATWRRAWKEYDVTMSRWPVMRAKSWLADNVADKEVVAFWTRYFDKVHAGEIDTWDYQLTFMCLASEGLCVVPGRNMISNIGFGADASRTKKKNVLSELPVSAMEFPLRHPSALVRNASAETLTERQQYSYSPFLVRIPKKALKKIIGKLLPG